MSALFITRWAQTDGANGARHHVIGVFLVGLDVHTEFKADMFVVVEMFAGQEVMGGQCVRCAIRRGNSIQPKNSIPNETNEHDAWESFERKRVVAAACAVFDCLNVAFDLGDVFILGAKIETDVTKDGLKRLKFWISKHGSNAETASTVGLDHLAEGRSDGRNLMIG